MGSTAPTSMAIPPTTTRMCDQTLRAFTRCRPRKDVVFFRAQVLIITCLSRTFAHKKPLSLTIPDTAPLCGPLRGNST